ncbi:unnamed protein product [Parnassius apollo]|uniref:(apollo) hypothetical protein n=1 Tax=Parnassius apollo TaxID=110799 RepID=A0A8S3XM31_PARAO|nr:unnamed protein product [Parnassius apollo]
MNKPLSSSDIELLINQQNTDDFNSEEPERVERGSSASLIMPEDLGIQCSELNTIEEVMESSDQSISLLQATEEPSISSEPRQVLSPLPIFDNLSDNSDDDPDWAPETSLRRRILYPLANEDLYDKLNISCSAENVSSLSVQDLRSNRQLFLRRRRILPSLDSDIDNSGILLPENITSASVSLPSTVKRNKEARIAGKPYLGYKKLDSKWTACIERPKRVLKSRCSHTIAAPTSKNSFLCALVTDEEREKLTINFGSSRLGQRRLLSIKDQQ